MLTSLHNSDLQKIISNQSSGGRYEYKRIQQYPQHPVNCTGHYLFVQFHIY